MQARGCTLACGCTHTVRSTHLSYPGFGKEGGSSELAGVGLAPRCVGRDQLFLAKRTLLFAPWLGSFRDLWDRDAVADSMERGLTRSGKSASSSPAATRGQVRNMLLVLL